MGVKILNLYAGIGGNRKLWDEVMDVDVTAVEYDRRIAEIYQDNFPEDKVIVEDAHKYLEKHFKDFDFIWSSPPCPTHSTMKVLIAKSEHKLNRKKKPEYPNMDLYQEIILLKHFFDKKFCVENVRSYYQPLIQPTVDLYRHFFWSNFPINRKSEKELNIKKINTARSNAEELMDHYGMYVDFSKFDTTGLDKAQIVRNCVHPEIGKHILECAFKNKQSRLM